MTETSPDTRPRERPKCSYRDADVRSCGMAPLINSDPPRCFVHSESTRERRAQALSKGGRASGRARQGRSIQAVIDALYGSTEDLEPGFKLLDASEVRRPQARLLLDDDDKVVYRDGRPWVDDPWTCTVHNRCLRLKALALVGLKPFKGHYELGERSYSAAQVEAWLATVAPNRVGTRS